MAITIPGGGGSVITFNLSNASSALVNYSQDFADAVEKPGDISFLPVESAEEGGLNIFSSGDSISTTLTQGSQYTYIAAASPSFLFLANSNETVAAGALATVVEQGNVGGERVIFIDGNNTFDGSSTGVGGDTIIGGTGYDTINTGVGATTVYGGYNTSITLNDSASGAGDVVALTEAGDTVYAIGAADTIYAAATSTVDGGSNFFTLVTQSTALSLTVNAGTGAGVVVISAGNDVTYNSDGGGGLGVIVGGAGNETLQGAGATSGFVFFADPLASDAGTINVTGGVGFDYFQTGAGTENYTAGSGTAEFSITSVSGGASITISDFNSFDSVNFLGLGTTEETALLANQDKSVGSASTAGGNLTVTLTDGTTVQFVGVTSLGGHLY
jgi:hypothetical protein